MTTLMVASTGGHLKQLHCLAPRLRGLDDEIVWVTFDTAQSRSLLANERVICVHDQPPRDWRAGLRNLRAAGRILRCLLPERVISTGAGVALSFLPAAASMGIDCHFIESATRLHGPSLTGRALRWVPGVHLYTQSELWARWPWQYRGSVFDGFEVCAGSRRPISKAVVTMGTLDAFPFDRMISRLQLIMPPEAEVLWQTGPLATASPPAGARARVPASELEQAMREADLVVSHAGTGSALAALEAGRCPVLVPRCPAYGEHVDDHQKQIAHDLSSRGLALSCSPDLLNTETLHAAAAKDVFRVAAPGAFQLVGRAESPVNAPVGAASPQPAGVGSGAIGG